MDKLITVRKDVQTKTEQLEKTVRVTEREYSKKMAELTKSFDVSFLLMSYIPYSIFRPGSRKHLFWYGRKDKYG